MDTFQISFTRNGGIEQVITVGGFSEEDAIQEAFLALFEEDFINGESNFYELKNVAAIEEESIACDFDQIFLEWAFALFFELVN